MPELSKNKQKRREQLLRHIPNTKRQLIHLELSYRNTCVALEALEKELRDINTLEIILQDPAQTMIPRPHAIITTGEQS